MLELYQAEGCGYSQKVRETLTALGVSYVIQIREPLRARCIRHGPSFNAKYPDEVFFERQAYLNLMGVGTTTPRRRFDRLSDWGGTSYGDTHLHTRKKIGTPTYHTPDSAERSGTIAVTKRVWL